MKNYDNIKTEYNVDTYVSMDNYDRCKTYAVEGTCYSQKYTKDGIPHRLDGPAVIHFPRVFEYWIDGVKYSEAEYKLRMFCAGYKVND